MSTGKKAQRPPDGQIRLSQLVTTFGPGAMIDLLDHAVLVGGTDYWRYEKAQPLPELDEPRLREAVFPRVKALGLTLSHSAPFRTGPEGNDDSRGPWNGIQVAEFPAWFVCQACRALSHRKSLEEKSGKYRHQCSRSKVGHCVPVRFVATCKDGHLEEFPWNWFVHHEGEACDGKDLHLIEGATGDFAEILVKCDACHRTRPLSHAREDMVLPNCHGRRPWLGRQADQPCAHKLHLLSRTASNAYFAQTVSALTIPEKGRELQKAVGSAKLWPVLKRADTADRVATLRAMVDDVNVSLADITGKASSDYSNDEIAAAVRAVHGGDDAPREGLRTAEYKQFLTAKNEKPGEIPPREEVFFASRYVPEKTKPLPNTIADITLVKKLRRITAQVGFTRLSSPTPDLQGNYDDAAKLATLTLAENWLPATEVFGEGVLIRFDEERVRAWEERPVVVEHAKALLAGFVKRFSKEDIARFPGAR
ncbi:MAG TPA: DrmB family protein, partial [Polyangiaceae bacterium]|nr:DrmB family protein [Polyangiaceae bacterium]